MLQLDSHGRVGLTESDADRLVPSTLNPALRLILSFAGWVYVPASERTMHVGKIAMDNYAESGTNIDDAGRMADLILKVPNRLLGAPYFDTITWVKYRQGHYSQAHEQLGPPKQA
jgi:hypothetical protein